MMIIATPYSTWGEAEDFLLDEPREKFGFFLCGVTDTRDGPRFCVREFLPVEDRHLDSGFRTERQVELDFLLDVINRAKEEGLVIVEVHTHPLSDERVTFSAVDDREMPEFVSYAMDSLDGRPYAAVVLGRNSLDARYWEDPDEHRPVERVVIAGDKFDYRVPTSSPLNQSGGSVVLDRYDRQIRFLGEPGQGQLGRLRVGVVGAGGIGSHVVQQLAYLGVRDFHLVDPDTAEESNLNRTVGVYPWDVGLPKVAMAARLIQQVGADEEVDVTAIEEDLQSEAAIRGLLASDIIVGCVDNDGARQLLNELSRVGHIPYLDVATGIETADGDLAQMGGRTAFVHPDGPCLHCMAEIDRDEARYFLKLPEEREDDREAGYIDEAWENPNPSVVSLNGAIASSAMNEVLLYVTGADSVVPLTYHYIREPGSDSQRLARRRVEHDPDCYTCSLGGIGDRADLGRYTRQNNVNANRPEALAEQIYGYGVAVITAALMIFLVYTVLKTLVGQLPAQVGGLLFGLVGLYAVVVNRKLRKELLDWLQVRENAELLERMKTSTNYYEWV